MPRSSRQPELVRVKRKARDERDELLYYVSRIIHPFCAAISAHRALVHPPKVRRSRSIPQQFGRHVSRSQHPALLTIPALVVEHHVCSEYERQNQPRSAECCGCGECGDVLWRVLVSEDVGTD